MSLKVLFLLAVALLFVPRRVTSPSVRLIVPILLILLLIAAAPVMASPAAPADSPTNGLAGASLSAENLAAIAGTILSLAFSYIPGLSGWFDGRLPTQKRLIMAALLLIIAGAAFGLACAQIVTAVTCDRPGAVGLVQTVIAALVANQAAFLISPRRVAAKILQ